MIPSAFAALLAPQCSVVETDVRCDAINGLFDEERVYTAGMNGQRLREFTAGRHCARAALIELNLPPVAIDKGLRGEPLFVPGVTGSITHTQNYCAAALSLTSGIMAIGIDAQTNISLEEPLFRRVLGRDPGGRPDHHGYCEGTLIFSLNEAFYKAVCRVTPRPVRWRDWRLHLTQEPGKCEIETLTLELASLLAPLGVDIRYAFDRQRIYSAATLWDRETVQRFASHSTARKSVS
jgi:4'-phosphopantetheinyl transferase EntD